MRAMALRCLVTFLLLALIGQVSLQDFVKIDSVIGEDVNLPCLNENQQEITNVLWRYSVSRKVLNIVNGKSSSENQDVIFRNQVDSFPSEYEKGNYSIKLKDVKMIHAGNYTCFLQKTNHEKMVQLVVKEKPKEKELKPNQPQQRTNSSMEAQPRKILTLLIALLGISLHLI